jgi:hypothetical protein
MIRNVIAVISIKNLCHLLEMLLLFWLSRCFKSFSHLLKRLLIDFATGIALAEYLYCRGLVLWGSGMISDDRWIFRSEPAEQCPGKYCEQGYPDKCPKQGDHLSKKFRIKSKHKRLSFLVFGLYLGE